MADGWRPNRGVTLLLPLGSIIITLPPAHDFATSGLENGLSIFWVAALWCLFLAWAKRDPTTSRRENAATGFLAFVAGLAPLIRPELTLLGALVLLVLVCAPSTSQRADLVGRWGMRLAIIVVAGILPVATRCSGWATTRCSSQPGYRQGRVGVQGG